jgi:hypothetical protein
VDGIWLEWPNAQKVVRLFGQAVWPTRKHVENEIEPMRALIGLYWQ